MQVYQAWQANRPVLIGTTSVQESNEVYNLLAGDYEPFVGHTFNDHMTHGTFAYKRPWYVF